MHSSILPFLDFVGIACWLLALKDESWGLLSPLFSPPPKPFRLCLMCSRGYLGQIKHLLLSARSVSLRQHLRTLPSTAHLLTHLSYPITSRLVFSPVAFPHRGWEHVHSVCSCHWGFSLWAVGWVWNLKPGHLCFPSLWSCHLSQSQIGCYDSISIFIQPCFSLEFLCIFFLYHIFNDFPTKFFTVTVILLRYFSHHTFLTLPFQIAFVGVLPSQLRSGPLDVLSVAPSSVLLTACIFVTLSCLSCHRPWQ